MSLSVLEKEASSSVMCPRTHVAILLATKDGQRFLNDQLASYASQTHSDWSLHVSDDGSTDSTLDLVKQFAQTQSNHVTLRDGPRRGHCQNFLSLAQDKNIEADYFAFSDQDDIWYPDKLERAIAVLREVAGDKPALYGTRTELIGETGAHLGFSPLFERPLTFQNALVQNVCGGNTMVFNRAAKRLLENIGNVDVVAHDWWLYQTVSSVEGLLFYDPSPSVKYRQHDRNAVGSNEKLSAKLHRLRMLLTGTLRAWNDKNLNALLSIQSTFVTPSLETLQAFAAARTAPGLFSRLAYLRKSGVYRQSTTAQLGLIVASCLRKL